jgi:tetratricopeptide (TPR) repeat protein
MHPSEMTGELLLPLIPALESIDQLADRRPAELARIIAETVSLHAATTFLMEHTEWDVTAVYFNAVDHASHGFMRFHPPQREDVKEADFELYRNVVAGVYRFHDMMLERQLELAGPDAAVILLSDHGFHSDHLRPRAIPKVPAGPAAEHRAFGVLCMAGPGIRQGETVHGASILDITPTLLALLGLPVGEDMAGHVLTQALDESVTVTTIPSWEDVEGADGSHSADARIDPWAEEEAMRQLVALGYVDSGDADAAGRAARATREANLNLARVYRSTGRNEKALALFRSIAQEEPDNDRYRAWLMQGLMESGHLTEARSELAALRASEYADASAITLMEGHLLLAERRPAEAIAAFDSLADEAGSRVSFGVPVGEAYLRLRQWNDAAAAFSGALLMDVDNPRALHGLAVAHIGLRDYRAAVEYALATVARVYHFPEAHFHLGVAMTRLGWADRAEQAFLVALRQRPSLAPAHKWLARIYRDYLRNPTRARHHRNEFDRLRVTDATSLQASGGDPDEGTDS